MTPGGSSVRSVWDLWVGLTSDPRWKFSGFGVGFVGMFNE